MMADVDVISVSATIALIISIGRYITIDAIHVWFTIKHEIRKHSTRGKA